MKTKPIQTALHLVRSCESLRTWTKDQRRKRGGPTVFIAQMLLRPHSGDPQSMTGEIPLFLTVRGRALHTLLLLSPRKAVVNRSSTHGWRTQSGLCSGRLRYSCRLSPEGRQSIARGVSPWCQVKRSPPAPKSDSKPANRRFCRPFRLMRSRWIVSQGSRPWLFTAAPSGLAVTASRKKTRTRSFPPIHNIFISPIGRVTIRRLTPPAHFNPETTMLRRLATTRPRWRPWSCRRRPRRGSTCRPAGASLPRRSAPAGCWRWRCCRRSPCSGRSAGNRRRSAWPPP